MQTTTIKITHIATGHAQSYRFSTKQEAEEFMSEKIYQVSPHHYTVEYVDDLKN